MGILKKRKKSSYEERILSRVDALSDEDLLKLEKKLYFRSGCYILLGILLFVVFILGIFMVR